MKAMNKEDVQSLSKLARIRLTDEETENFSKDISSIVSYVSVIQGIVADDNEAGGKLGVRYNVFRSDVVTNQPDGYTDDLLREMPNSKDRYMVVKKILKTDNE